MVNAVSHTLAAPGVIVGHFPGEESLPSFRHPPHLLPSEALPDSSTASAINVVGRGCSAIFLPGFAFRCVPQ